jgi:pimeloyl-ACP methyl ester carboxylesterase
MRVPSLSHEPEPVKSFDGTLIAGRRMGDGEALPLLVCNGVGANLAPWRRVLVDIVRDRPVVAWDLRGTLASGAPASDRINAGAHAEDAIAVVEHFGYDRFAVASWSNGTRVGIELAHRYPERVPALALVCGGYGFSLTRLLRRLELPAAFPLAAGVAKYFSRMLEGPLRALIARPELAGLVRQSGFVGPTADIYALVDMLRGMADCDLSMILAIFEAIAGDPVPDLATSIEATTLVVAGERDQFAPLRMMREAATSIPGARFEVYAKATHYLPIEFPARLVDDLRKLLAEAGV